MNCDLKVYIQVIVAQMDLTENQINLHTKGSVCKYSLCS